MTCRSSREDHDRTRPRSRTRPSPRCLREPRPRRTRRYRCSTWPMSWPRSERRQRVMKPAERLPRWPSSASRSVCHPSRFDHPAGGLSCSRRCSASKPQRLPPLPSSVSVVSPPPRSPARCRPQPSSSRMTPSGLRARTPARTRTQTTRPPDTAERRSAPALRGPRHSGCAPRTATQRRTAPLPRRRLPSRTWRRRPVARPTWRPSAQP